MDRTLRLAVLTLALAGACTGPARAAEPATPRRVEVERVKPRRAKLETLRFLRANRDFIRARYDLLREQPLADDATARPLDPRFLAYARLRDAALASGDSVAAAEDARARTTLLTHVGDLTRLEEQLDGLERALAAQRDRLAVLERDFAGRQETALAVVLSGDAVAAGIDHVTLVAEDGAPTEVALSEAQVDVLRRGGVLQLAHGRVEPREQTFEVRLGGPAGALAPVWLTLDPARDQLTLLRLDLSALRAGGDPGALAATTWTHDAAVLAGDAEGATAK